MNHAKLLLWIPGWKIKASEYEYNTGPFKHGAIDRMQPTPGLLTHLVTISFPMSIKVVAAVFHQNINIVHHE